MRELRASLAALGFVRRVQLVRGLKSPKAVLPVLVAVAAAALAELAVYSHYGLGVDAESGRAADTGTGLLILAVLAFGLGGSSGAPLPATGANRQWALALPDGERALFIEYTARRALMGFGEVVVATSVLNVIRGRPGWLAVPTLSLWTLGEALMVASLGMLGFLSFRNVPARWLARTLLVSVAVGALLAARTWLPSAGSLLSSVGQPLSHPGAPRWDVTLMLLLIGAGLFVLASRLAVGYAEDAARAGQQVDAGVRRAEAMLDGGESSWQGAVGLSGEGAFLWRRLAAWRRLRKRMPPALLGFGALSGLLTWALPRIGLYVDLGLPVFAMVGNASLTGRPPLAYYLRTLPSDRVRALRFDSLGAAAPFTAMLLALWTTRSVIEGAPAAVVVTRVFACAGAALWLQAIGGLVSVLPFKRLAAAEVGTAVVVVSAVIAWSIGSSAAHAVDAPAGYLVVALLSPLAAWVLSVASSRVLRATEWR